MILTASYLNPHFEVLGLEASSPWPQPRSLRSSKVITFFRTEMFQNKFIKDLRLILFVSRFRMIVRLSSKFASL